MLQTAITTTDTLAMDPIESKREFTINFIETLWEITLKGRSVLKSLRIFIAGMSTPDKSISRIEVNTIKPSS
jgi:hypothetical protein